MSQQTQQTQQKQRKLLYWLFKILSVVISCALPIWAICEKFPIWKVTHGVSRSIGTGGILVLIVLVVVFRRAVFNFIVDKCKLKHAPPLVIWLVMLILSYVLILISNFMRDMTTIFWMGLIGCAIGTVLTFIAENKYGEKEEEKDDE